MASVQTQSVQIFAQYVRTESFFHSIDPISKLVAVFGISIWAVMITNNLHLFILHVLLWFVALVLGRVPFGVFLRGARIFIIFGAGVFLMQLIWNRQGETLFTVGFLNVTSGALHFGIKKWLMLSTFGLASFIYIWTTNPRQTVVGLAHLGLPYRYAWALFLVLRYVPLFQNEVTVIREAQAVRGIRRGAGIAGRIEMYKRYTVPLLVSMVRKATQLAIAMDGRAFGAYPDRSFRDEFHWSYSGVALMLIILIAILGAIFVYGAPFVSPTAPPIS
jgi:energy-coupling factor transport system permease protein